jgi:DNA replication protein DnaC
MAAVMSKFRADPNIEPPRCERCGTLQEYRENGIPQLNTTMALWVYMCRCWASSIADQWYPDRPEAHITFDGVHPELKDQKQVALALCKHREWAIFQGDVGTGKTFLARCIVNDVLDRGSTAQLITWSEVLRKIRQTFSDSTAGNEQAIIEQLGALDLLVIDDYGAQRSNSDFALAKLQDIIDARYQRGRMTVITTNLNPQGFADSMDPRTTDRIAAKGSFVVFDGVNLRQEVASQRRMEVAST